MVTVEHLTKRFGSKTAVDDVSFSVKRGEVVGFLGPNGAGKTTTMRLLAGYLSPDDGTIEIDGQELRGENTKPLHKIGYMPELNPLYKDMLVSEVLGFSAELKGLKRKLRKKRFDFVSKAVGIQDVFYQPIRTLSKGYRQRVGLAIALLNDPKVLLLDEPTEGLDPKQRQDLRSLIKDLSKNHTIFISTHILAEAQAVCNRIIIISEGSFVADGSPEELSRQQQKGRVFVLEVEGKDIVDSLKKIEGVEDVRKEDKDGHVRVEIETKEQEIRPEISKLVAKNNWTVWEMSERSVALEDVFGAVTAKK